jgi:pre-mRNA-splicing factor SPF27
LCNLELLQKFGNNAWRLHNYQVEGQVEIVKRVLEAEKSKVIECNQARKAMQASMNLLLLLKTSKLLLTNLL